MAKLYKNVGSDFIFITHEEAELLKLTCNTFHALKISFANEVGRIGRDQGIDAHKVMEIFCLDKQLNISSRYLIPGFAYGGPCLSKDTRALQSLSQKLNSQCPIVENIETSNHAQIDRVVKLIRSLKKTSIGFLGLAFKDNLKDIRKSPILPVIDQLSSKQHSIFVTDLNIAEVQDRYLDGALAHNKKVLLTNIDDLLEKAEIIVVLHRNRTYRDKLKTIRGKSVIDLVGIRDAIPQNNRYFLIDRLL